jgi:hypothetical protein
VVRATTREIAQGVAVAATRLTKSLIADLKADGSPDDPRFRKLAFAVEVLLFKGFVMDVIIWREFGEHGDVIRQAFAEYLLDAAHGSPGTRTRSSSGCARPGFKSMTRRCGIPSKPGNSNDLPLRPVGTL